MEDAIGATVALVVGASFLAIGWRAVSRGSALVRDESLHASDSPG